MERFIVGTGRCGSTLLSRMLAHNRQLLSLSEFWSAPDRAAVFDQRSIDGATLAATLERVNLLVEFVISRSPFLDTATGHAIRKEVPSFSRRAHGEPGIKLFLAKIEEDPDALYRDTLAFFSDRPVQGPGEHWRAFFDWLARRQNRQMWVERSGVSIEHVDRLIDWYPDGRFVHLHRDGPTNALAIRAFRHFVLYCSFHTDPPGDDELRRALTCEIGGADDPIMRRMSRDIPSLEEFGAYWSWQIARGCRGLLRLAPERRLDIAYEDLVAEPKAVLARLAAFLDLPDDGDWIARAAAEIDPEGIADRLSALDGATRAALETACLSGQVLLGRVDRNGFEETMIRARKCADQVTIAPT